MLSNFFDPPWRKVVDGLRESSKGYVLNEAGFDLRALGRLAEAAQPMQAALETMIRLKDWNNAAIYASNLSELYLTIGDVRQALDYAEQSVKLADKSGDEFMRMVNRTKAGDSQHQAGNLPKAQSAFVEAEKIQKERQPEFQLLYSLPGFLYCDLLSSQGRAAEVERRARQTLEWMKQYGGLLDVALDNLSLGRALTHLSPVPSPTGRGVPAGRGEVAIDYLNRAVDGLRQAGHQEFITRGLLARAEYYRVVGDFEKAKKDSDEAFAISTRGGMGLHLADCHLAYARLQVGRLKARAEHSRSVEGSKEQPSTLNLEPSTLLNEAKKHVSTAKEMIEKMGYHRRDGEVAALEKELAVL